MAHARDRLLRRSLLPTSVSLALHGGLMLLVLGVTVRHIAPTERGPTLLELDRTPPTRQNEPTPQAVRTPAPAPAPTRTPTPDDARVETARDAAAGAITKADPFDLPPEFTSTVAAPTPMEARVPEQPAAVFAGLQARAATRIVYVVDTSGSMVHTLSFVLDELARSVSRLQPTQSFQVVLFADKPGEPGFRTAPIEADRRGLIRATPANRVAVSEWLGRVVAGGRSNPDDGLRAAIELRPDLIFMLARGIQRTGTGSAQAERVESLLTRLDELNPIDPKTGHRPAIIKTIQFVDEDPTGLMQRVARAHGDGEGSYRLLRPEALNDDPPPPPPAPLPEPIEHAIAKAAGVLVNADRDLSPLAVLTGVATRAEVDAVRDAARSTLDLLADAPPATSRTADGRAQLLRARAALLAAAAEQRAAHRLDLARRAIADAAPLPIIDPETDAQRDITLALAQTIAGEAEAAHADLLALIRNRADADLDATTVASARLALVVAGDAINPRSSQAQQARDALVRSLDNDPRDPSGWPDQAWRALAAATLARSLAESGTPTEAALAPLLSQLVDKSQPQDHRRALLYPRLAVVARGLPDLSPPVLRAMAEHASWTGRTDEAVEMFLRLSDRTTDPDARADAIRSAAVLLDRRGDPGDEARARALFLRFAVERPDHPDTHHALTLAFARAGAAPEQLETVLDIAPDHALADRWRLEIAGVRRGAAGLELLDQVTSPGEASARLELELIDEMLAGPNAGDRALLVRAADLAERLGAGMTNRRRLDLARGLIEGDPEKALDALSGVEPGSPESDASDLLRVRARLALGWDAEAFETARDLAARREPLADAIFWEAATAWLELGAARGGPDARLAAAAHVARLRRLHPGLGGEPWTTRLDAISE